MNNVRAALGNMRAIKVLVKVPGRRFNAANPNVKSEPSLLHFTIQTACYVDTCVADVGRRVAVFSLHIPMLTMITIHGRETLLTVLIAADGMYTSRHQSI